MAQLIPDRIREIAEHAGDWDDQELRDELEKTASAAEQERNALVHALEQALFAGVFPPETHEAYQSATRVLKSARGTT